jgi:pseudaminic acid synthase
MNEEEFADMVKAVREVEKALGRVSYELSEKQVKGRDFCRSLYVVKDIKKGEIITEENVRSIRPGFGMHPKELKNVLGKTARKGLLKGMPLNKKMII